MVFVLIPNFCIVDVGHGGRVVEEAECVGAFLQLDLELLLPFGGSEGTEYFPIQLNVAGAWFVSAGGDGECIAAALLAVDFSPQQVVLGSAAECPDACSAMAVFGLVVEGCGGGEWVAEFLIVADVAALGFVNGLFESPSGFGGVDACGMWWKGNGEGVAADGDDFLAEDVAESRYALHVELGKADVDAGRGGGGVVDGYGTLSAIALLEVAHEDVASLPTHCVGILGGCIWGLGTLLSYISAGKAGAAISYALGQGAPMVAALWGVFVWKEFKGCNRQVAGLLALMFVLFIAGLSLIVLSGGS